MQIGKFAALCGTKISVLRHYDREGLLVPEYIDKFTGYRYYSAEQKDVFMRITLLKSAGFSLSEIREIVINTPSDEEIMSLVRKKKDELCRQLEMLNEVMKTMTDTQHKIKVYFKSTDAGDAVFTERADGNDFPALCRAIEAELDEKHYQRTSTYRSYGEPMSNEVYAECDVVKLTEDMTMPHDDIDLPFVDDDIVGKWEIVGEYDVADDFYAGRRHENTPGSEKGVRFIYFLPNGERYWCYGWTRGKILFQNEWCSSAEDYFTAEYADERYMFVAHKSYFFMHGGRPTALVLRQLDTKSYTKAEIARRDDVDMVFVDDAVISS